MTKSDFLACVLTNRENKELLQRLRTLGLPGCYLTAGCLFQTLWNVQSGQPPEWGIKDYDVFYFDDDTSWDAEDRAIREVVAITSDLSITVEVKNQARVHLWYPERFGREYPQLKSAQEGIDRFLISCTCVGIEVKSNTVYAPNGLTDLARGLLTMNPLNRNRALFLQKAESYRSRWPWLSILD